jgi:AcrR family transcriptional regulator
MKTVIDHPRSSSADSQDAEAQASNPAGKLTPRRMRRAAEIVAAARETFLEKGFARASVSEIAAKVGVVEGLLYAYFPTKRDLLDEVLRGMYEPLIREMEDGFSRLQGLRSRMRFLIWRHLRVYVEDPGLSRLVLHEVRTRPEYFNSALHELHVRYTAFLMRTVHDAIASSELPGDTDAEMVRGMVYGGIEHRMWGVLFGRDTVDVEVAADRFTDMVLRGIAPYSPALFAAPPVPATTFSAGNRDDLERRLERLEKLVAAGLMPPPALDAPAPRRRKKTS